MSQSRVNLATAKRELAERQDEANLCMVELKHAQEVLASGGTGPKVLSVTVQEVFGAITVDRVAVRPDTTPAQEKVVVEGIPCKFNLDATVESFDLVFMAENTTSEGIGEPKPAVNPAPAVAAAKGATPAGEAPAAEAAASDGNETDGVVISAEDAAEALEAEAAAAAMAAPVVVETEVEEGSADLGEGEAVEEAAEAADTAAAVGAADAVSAEVDAVPEAARPVADAKEVGQRDIVEPEAVQPAVGAEENTAGDQAASMSASAGEEVDISADVPAPAVAEGEEEEVAAGSDAADGVGDPFTTGDSLDTAGAEAETAAATEAEAAAAAAAEEAEAVTGERSEIAEAVVAEETEKVADAADAGATAAALVATNGDVTAASPAAAKALGCSTGTTEVVVPSSELNFKLSHGQWRYLEADSMPAEDGDRAVEVTKGVRFSTSLKPLDSRDDDNRILELSEKVTEAERRVRAAEAMIKKLQPSSAIPNSRKKSGGGAGGRKSALKKGKGGTRAVKSDAVKRRGAASTLSAVIEKAYSKAKAGSAIVWNSRNLIFFAAAVAAMHRHGDYLAV